MKKLVVLSGAGMSAESGIKTFRDSDGLWENHRVEDVATFDAWKRNQQLVLDFYNERRAHLKNTQPNAGHLALAHAEHDFEVQIITQNVDDLHERAGSSQILHLHGELLKVRSSLDKNLIYDWQHDLKKGDKCEKGSQLRPHIVWFGEDVPNIHIAEKIVAQADFLLIIGTSLLVYPAANLIFSAPKHCTKAIVDTKIADLAKSFDDLFCFEEKAGTGVAKAIKLFKDIAHDD